jgi:hypothetical protein
MTTVSIAVPTNANANRRVAGHHPVTRRRHRAGTNSAAELVGALAIPASNRALSMKTPGDATFPEE